MTGPGEGKIPVDAAVLLSHGGREVSVECDVYIHVKGYSLARVTHIDVEGPVMNELIKPGESTYVPFRVEGHRLTVRFRKAYYVRSLRAFASSLVIESEVLGEVLAGVSSMAYVGGKVGGVFLGFHRDVIRRLEEYAASLGVPPRSSRARE